MASKETQSKIKLPKFKVLTFTLSSEVGIEYVKSKLTTSFFRENPGVSNCRQLIDHLFTDEEQYYSQDNVIEVDGYFMGICDHEVLLTREGEQNLTEIQAVFDEKRKQNGVDLTRELDRFNLAISSERQKQTICCTHISDLTENTMVLDSNMPVCGLDSCNKHDCMAQKYCRQIYSTDQRPNTLANPELNPKSKKNTSKDIEEGNKFKCGACQTYAKASKRSPCTNPSCTKFQVKASKKNTQNMVEPQNKKTTSTNKTTKPQNKSTNKTTEPQNKSTNKTTEPQRAAAHLADLLEVNKIKLPIFVPEVSAQFKAVFDKFKSTKKAQGTFMLLVKNHDLSQFTSNMLCDIYYESFSWGVRGDTIQEMRNKMKVAVKSALRNKEREEELNAWKKYEQEEEQRKAQKKKDEERRIQSMLLEDCLLYTSPSPRDGLLSRMPSSA